VVKGEVLASLDTTELVLTLAQSQANLEIMQAQLAKLERPPSEHELASAQTAVDLAENAIAGAEATLASAQANYDKLMAGPTEQERTLNAAKVMEAEAQVKRAQQAYDLV
jgi:multidrug efflux pump subunit AcrA (membrane-fusion protein)